MSSKPTPLRMKVVAHRPLRSAVMMLGGLLLAVGAGIGGYWIGRNQLVSVASSVVDDAGEVSTAQRIVELERKLADVQLSQVVDGDANESLRQTIKSLRDELSASQDEVLFYRQLMAPSEAQRGLRVEKLELAPGAVPTEVKYRLLLTQVADKNNWATGTVTVDVVGTSGDEQVVLPLTELTPVESYPLTFKFRYFQDFTGTLTIPEGLKPEQVVVAAAMSGKDGKRVQKTFSWALEED
jgi:Family of unknown function (DUF6776)